MPAVPALLSSLFGEATEARTKRFVRRLAAMVFVTLIAFLLLVGGVAFLLFWLFQTLCEAHSLTFALSVTGLCAISAAIFIAIISACVTLVLGHRATHHLKNTGESKATLFEPAVAIIREHPLGSMFGILITGVLLARFPLSIGRMLQTLVLLWLRGSQSATKR